MGATQSDAIFSQLHLIIMIIMTACLFCLQTRFIQPTLSAAQEHMMGNPSLPASLTNYIHVKTETWDTLKNFVRLSSCSGPDSHLNGAKQLHVTNFHIFSFLSTDNSLTN